MPAMLHELVANLVDNALRRQLPQGARLLLDEYGGWAWRHERHKIDLTEFPHVKRWYESMMARPGVQRGFAVKLS